MGQDFPNLRNALITELPGLLNGQTVDVAGTATLLAGITAGDSTGDDLDAVAVAGFVRIEILDDVDNGITRLATVDIDVFTTTTSRTAAIAERIRGILRDETKIGAVVIDRRRTRSGPKRVPWDNSRIRRSNATYTISTRR